MAGACFRLGFIVACCGFVYGLIRLADYASTAIALVVGLVGVVAAIALTEDWSQPTEPGKPRPGRARSPRPWRRTGPYEGE